MTSYTTKRKFIHVVSPVNINTQDIHAHCSVSWLWQQTTTT